MSGPDSLEPPQTPAVFVGLPGAALERRHARWRPARSPFYTGSEVEADGLRIGGQGTERSAAALEGELPTIGGIGALAFSSSSLPPRGGSAPMSGQNPILGRVVNGLKLPCHLGFNSGPGRPTSLECARA